MVADLWRRFTNSKAFRAKVIGLGVVNAFMRDVARFTAACAPTHGLAAFIAET
ncbi:hypothetical protein [Methylobacterium flocculans]|uniref:hypothetical protein n=1 Tax=Methylobacterium flocculans TaxID=2984843 RepID=UPI0021F34145|nr:hypothetical protein [Methylobacterium sp. FF17]